MGLRIETLIIAQILGVLFHLSSFVNDIAFERETLPSGKTPIVTLQGVVKSITDPRGVVYNYVLATVFLLAILTYLRQIFRPSLPNFLYGFTFGGTFILLFVYIYPALTWFCTYDSATALKFVPQLMYYQNVFSLLLLGLLILSFLGSFTYYLLDPIELVLMNVLAGVLIVDVAYDLPFLSNPTVNGLAHYNLITHGVGTSFLALEVPLLIFAIALILVYRVLVQRYIRDFFVLLLLIAAAGLLQTYVLPLEEKLVTQGHSASTVPTQKSIAFSHIAFLGLIFSVTAFKLTLAFLTDLMTPKIPPPPPTPIPEKITLTAKTESPTSKHDVKKIEISQKQKTAKGDKLKKK